MVEPNIRFLVRFQTTISVWNLDDKAPGFQNFSGFQSFRYLLTTHFPDFWCPKEEFNISNFVCFALSIELPINSKIYVWNLDDEASGFLRFLALSATFCFSRTSIFTLKSQASFKIVPDYDEYTNDNIAPKHSIICILWQFILRTENTIILYDPTQVSESQISALSFSHLNPAYSIYFWHFRHQ